MLFLVCLNCCDEVSDIDREYHLGVKLQGMNIAIANRKEAGITRSGITLVTLGCTAIETEWQMLWLYPELSHLHLLDHLLERTGKKI